MSPATLLAEGSETLQLSLSSATQTTLLAYLDFLEKWNHTYNLTAIRDRMEMVPKHLLDTLVVLPYLQGSQILDVGTGAGIPGLILAICHPHRHYTLLDSQAKKIRFIRQAMIELGIKNVDPIAMRVEDFHPTTPFDCIVSRAYGNLRLFCQHTLSFCLPEGQLLAMKGTYPEKELEEIKAFPLHTHIVPLHVPFLNAQRHLVVMKLANLAKSTKLNVSARA